MCLDLVAVLLSTALTDLGLVACASALCELSADRYPCSSLGLVKSLGVSVYSYIFYIIDTRIHHAVYSVSAAAANTDDLYINIGFECFLIIEI